MAINTLQRAATYLNLNLSKLADPKIELRMLIQSVQLIQMIQIKMIQ